MTHDEKIEQYMADYRADILDCGHHRTEPDHFHPSGYPLTTGYATEKRGGKDFRVCYDCAVMGEQAAFLAVEEKGVYSAYLSMDGERITTWTGGLLAKVIYRGTARTGFYGSEITYVNAVDSLGRHWYGKNAGTGMFINMHRNVAKG